jgi:hypothetical protein
MEKILDLFLKTPLAKRYLAGFAERGLIAVLTLIAGWLNLTAGTYEHDIAQFAAEYAPVIAATALILVARARMKKTELTINVAQANPPFVPRAEIDRQVNELTKPATPDRRTPHA